MRSKSDATRQRPERAAPVALQARGAERVGDGRVAEADEQRGLQRERHPLDDAARAGLDVLEVRQLVAQRGAEGVEARLRAGRLADLVRERLDGLAGSSTIARSTSSACTFPEPSQIEASGRLAVEPRHPRLLDVAVAAEALERLARVGRGALADPVLEDRGRDAADQGRLLVAGVGLVEARARATWPATVAASDSTARSASTFCISGCSTSRLPNAERPSQWLIAAAVPHRIPVAQPITQSSRVWLTISMIVGTPRPSSPTIRAQAARNSTSLEAFERLPSLSLSRWMWKRLRSPSGVKRGSRKHERPPSAWASTRNASHIGAEQNHLWPVISYSAPGTAAVQRRRRRRVGAHVRAALLLGHRHAAERAGLVGGRAELAVVVEREEARLPLGGDLGLLADRRDHRVGHRDRAADAGLDLREQHEERRPRDVRARAAARATAARAGPRRSRGP